MPLLNFANLNFELVDGWVDITGDLPAGSPETLARDDGVGALQFSTSLHDGKWAKVGIADLRAFLAEYCGKSNLPLGEPHVARFRKVISASIESRKPDELVFAWYVSDGKHFSLVTYTSLEPNNPKSAEELAEVQAMVPTLEFAPPQTSPT